VPSAAEAANTRDRTTRRFCTSPRARCRRTHPQRSAEKKHKKKSHWTQDQPHSYSQTPVTITTVSRPPIPFTICILYKQRFYLLQQYTGRRTSLVRLAIVRHTLCCIPGIPATCSAIRSTTGKSSYYYCTFIGVHVRLSVLFVHWGTTICTIVLSPLWQFFFIFFVGNAQQFAILYDQRWSCFLLIISLFYHFGMFSLYLAVPSLLYFAIPCSVIVLILRSLLLFPISIVCCISSTWPTLRMLL
jgi:hypothetical protein